MGNRSEYLRSQAARCRAGLLSASGDRIRQALVASASDYERQADLAECEAALHERRWSGGELLIDGQEEVFSRTEVELGRVEHKLDAGNGDAGMNPAHEHPVAAGTPPKTKRGP